MAFIGNTEQAVGTRIPRKKSQEQGPSKSRPQKAPAKIYFLKMAIYPDFKKVLFLV